MKFAAFLLAMPLWAQPTISNVRVDDIGHSSVRITWDSSPAAACSAGPKYGQRVRYGTTSSYGTIQMGYQCVVVANNQQMTLTGLACGVEYHYSAGSNNTGDDTNWGNSSDATFTTSACPATHPAPPALPAEVDVTMPTQGGTVHNVASNCSDLQSKLNVAVGGDTIRIPAGTVCTGNYFPPHGFGSKAITAVDVDDDEWNLVAHGYSNGNQLLVGGTFSAPWPVKTGQIVYVVNASADKFKVSLTEGGAAIDILSSGSAVRVNAWPLANSWVVIESTGTLPPEGVQLTPEWDSQLATIRTPVSQAGVAAFAAAPFYFGHDGSGSNGVLAHHYRFIGIKFTHEDYASAGALDPKPFYSLLNSRPDTSFVVIDRCAFKTRGYPDRLMSVTRPLDGRHIAVINSYVDGANYWKPYKIGPTFGTAGIQISVPAATTLRISPGTHYLGNTSCNIASNLDLTLTAGGTGTAYVDMTTSCAVRITAPSGTTVTCAGYAPGCPVSVGSAYPVNGNGERTGGVIGTVTVAATPAWSSPANELNNVSVWNTEGSGGFTTAHGPGPYRFENNNVQGTGVGLFYITDDNKVGDDGGLCNPNTCVTTFVPSDIVVRRNTFRAGFDKMPGHALSDGRAYGNRGQHVEFKQGIRVLMEGNRLIDNYREITPTGYAALVSCNATSVSDRATAECSDITFRYNLVHSTSGGLAFNANTPASFVRTRNTRRALMAHNILYKINGWAYDSTLTGTGAAGVPLVVSNGGEDIGFVNNTVFDNRGTCSHSLRVGTNPVEGFYAKNNILWYPDDSSCGGFSFISALDGLTRHKTAAMDVVLTAGPGNPSYIWTNNFLMPTYTNSQTPSGVVDASAVASAYAASPATFVQTGASVADRVAALKVLDPEGGNFALRHDSSAFRLGDDGRNLGADVDALNRALGVVRGVYSALTSATTFDIKWTPPSAFNCSVELSSDNFATTPTRLTANQGDARQSVQFTSLSAATTYRWRLLCATGIQAELTGGFRTP